jgi:hypothetical protein
MDDLKTIAEKSNPVLKVRRKEMLSLPPKSPRLWQTDCSRTVAQALTNALRLASVHACRRRKIRRNGCVVSHDGERALLTFHLCPFSSV